MTTTITDELNARLVDREKGADMPPSSSITDELNAELAALVQPLIERVERIDEELAEISKRTTELREIRKRAETTIRNLDPSRVPTKETPPTGFAPSETKIEELRSYLGTHRDSLNEDGFSSADLIKRDDWNGLASASYTSVLLRTLHDRGIVRLDRRGTGGAKIFRLV
jgi:hypothetical protein